MIIAAACLVTEGHFYVQQLFISTVVGFVEGELGQHGEWSSSAKRQINWAQMALSIVCKLLLESICISLVCLASRLDQTLVLLLWGLASTLLMIISCLRLLNYKDWATLLLLQISAWSCIFVILLDGRREVDLLDLSDLGWGLFGNHRSLKSLRAHRFSVLRRQSPRRYYQSPTSS